MEEEINLLDYWRILMKKKRMIVQVVMLATFLSVIVSLILPKTYKAEAMIIPIEVQKGGGLAAIAAQMGLGSLLGGIDGPSSSSAKLLAILKSRTLAEKIIDKYELNRFFYKDPQKAPPMETSVVRLGQLVTFTEDKKNQVIMIQAVLKDPQLAAKIVNGYVQELQSHISENTFTVAKKNRIFIEDQLERNKAELLESGKQLSGFYATNRISNVIPTVDVNLSLKANNDGGDTDKNSTPQDENQNPVLSSPTSTAPEVGIPGVPTAFAEIQNKAESIQQMATQIQQKIDQVKTVKDVPQQVYLQYLTLRRELLGQVNALLTSQYEMAKIDEAKEDLNFQVIDWARVPVRKYKPKRSQIVITAFVLSSFLSIFYVFFREYLEKMKKA